MSKIAVNAEDEKKQLSSQYLKNSAQSEHEETPNKTEDNKSVSVLFKENPSKYTILPIEHKDIWKMYEKHNGVIWQVSHVKLDDDKSDWEKLNENEKHYLKNVLGFFAASDGIVCENIVERFSSEVQLTEARFFYGVQTYMENIHSHMYSLLIDTYISDPVEKNRIINAIQTMPVINKKAMWAKKWIESDKPFHVRLVAFALVEGFFFSGAFCSIFWVRQKHGKKYLDGLIKANEYISRDENLHFMFACLLYNKYCKERMTEDEFQEIMMEAYNIETEFILDSLRCSLLGMNSDLMSEYIRHVANIVAINLEHEEPFPGAHQPFPFMDQIGMADNQDFFQGRPTDYQKPILNECEKIEYDSEEEF